MQLSNRRQFLGVAMGAGGVMGLAMVWRRLGQLANEGDRLPVLLPGGLYATRKNGWAMGAEVSILVLDKSPEVGRRAAEAALAEASLVDRLMSLYQPDSQLCQLNRDGILKAPDPRLVQVLRFARGMSQRTGGAFDVTVQPLWSLYNSAAAAGGLPEPAALDAARAHIDWRRVKVCDEEIRLEGEGTAVTLNGIAQGFAADRMRVVLQQHGIRHALINAGELAAMGSKDGGGPWTAGIQHPRREQAYLALARLQDRCLSTSGDYATRFTSDHAHHHLLDPRTGRSPQEFASVSVAAPTAMGADALSTAVFVLGPEKGLQLVRSTPGADALVAFKNGRTLATAGFPTADSSDA